MPLNFGLIGSNLAEAAEELIKLQEKAAIGTLNQAELQVGLRHAYHHLNFSWNARHAATSEYSGLTRQRFDEWGKYPSDIDED